MQQMRFLVVQMMILMAFQIQLIIVLMYMVIPHLEYPIYQVSVSLVVLILTMIYMKIIPILVLFNMVQVGGIN